MTTTTQQNQITSGNQCTCAQHRPTGESHLHRTHTTAHPVGKRLPPGSPRQQPAPLHRGPVRPHGTVRRRGLVRAVAGLGLPPEVHRHWGQRPVGVEVGAHPPLAPGLAGPPLVAQVWSRRVSRGNSLLFVWRFLTPELEPEPEPLRGLAGNPNRPPSQGVTFHSKKPVSHFSKKKTIQTLAVSAVCGHLSVGALTRRAIGHCG